MGLAQIILLATVFCYAHWNVYKKAMLKHYILNLDESILNLNFTLKKFMVFTCACFHPQLIKQTWLWHIFFDQLIIMFTVKQCIWPKIQPLWNTFQTHNLFSISKADQKIPTFSNLGTTVNSAACKLMS